MPHFDIKLHGPLTLILLLGLALRIWGIGFGLPNTNCRPDESILVQKALGFGTGDLNPHFFNYPTLFMYLLFGLYGSYFVLGNVWGVLASVRDFEWALLLDPSHVYLIGRWVVALFGGMTIWAVVRLGRTLYSSDTGLLAALFMAFSFLHVRDSHFVATDVPMTFFAVMALWGAARILQAGEWRDYIWAGICAGLALSTKYSALVLLVPLMVAHVLHGRERGGSAHRILTDRRGWIMVGAVVLIFLCGSPYVLLDARTALRDVFYEFRHLGRGHGVDLEPGWIYHLRFSLRYGLGLPLLAAGVGGVVLGLVRRRREDWLPLSFVLAYYGVIGHGQTVFVRYVIPLLPVLCVLGAEGVVRGIWAVRWLRGRQRALGLALGVLMILEPGYRSVRHDLLLAREDTRNMTQQWIGAHIPSGTRIAMHGGDYGEPQVFETRGGIERKLAHARSTWGPHYGRMFERMLSFSTYPPEPSYEVIQLRTKAPWNEPWIMTDYSWTSLRRAGILFVVTTEHFLDYSRSDAALEAMLREHGRLLKTFSPFAEGVTPDPVYDPLDGYYVPLAAFRGIERPGPIVRIYRVLEE